MSEQYLWPVRTAQYLEHKISSFSFLNLATLAMVSYCFGTDSKGTSGTTYPGATTSVGAIDAEQSHDPGATDHSVTVHGVTVHSETVPGNKAPCNTVAHQDGPQTHVPTLLERNTTYYTTYQPVHQTKKAQTSM